MQACKKIAVMTSGGDAPGMNAAVRGVVRACLNEGWQAYGIRDAFKGLAAGSGKSALNVPNSPRTTACCQTKRLRGSKTSSV